MMKEFKGIMPALVTPFTEDGDIDENGLVDLLEYLLDKGVHGFYVCGSTGEGLVLPVEKRMKMAELVKKHTGIKSKLIIHVGAIDTATSAKLAAHAYDIGADAISAVPPFYYTPDIKSLISHYSEISGAAELPMILYNIPGCVGYPVDAKMFEELTNIKNVTGIKFSDYNLFELSKIRQLKEGKLSIFFGCDEIFISGLMMGADGGIGSFYNIMPKAYVDLYDSFNKGDIQRVQKLQYRVNKYIDICLKYPNAATKEVLSMLGIKIRKYVIQPLRPLTAEEEGMLRGELEEAGFFDFVRNQ